MICKKLRVIVNGQEIRENDRDTEALPGRVLRNGRAS